MLRKSEAAVPTSRDTTGPQDRFQRRQHETTGEKTRLRETEATRDFTPQCARIDVFETLLSCWLRNESLRPPSALGSISGLCRASVSVICSSRPSLSMYSKSALTSNAPVGRINVASTSWKGLARKYSEWHRLRLLTAHINLFLSDIFVLWALDRQRNIAFRYISAVLSMFLVSDRLLDLLVHFGQLHE